MKTPNLISLKQESFHITAVILIVLGLGACSTESDQKKTDLTPFPRTPDVQRVSDHPKMNTVGGFVENKGQLGPNDPTLFYIQHNGMSCSLSPEGISYVWSAQTNDEQADNDQFTEHRVGVLWRNANPNVVMEGIQPHSDLQHFYNTEDSQPVLGVKNYQQVRYNNLYDNIDLVLYFQENHIKYDFLVHPGGDVRDIELEYLGQDSLFLDTTGTLNLQTSLGQLTELAPYTYQRQADQQNEVSSSYELTDNVIRFSVAEYDSTKTLVIDPEIIWATYYGNLGLDSSRGVATDRWGNVYIVGVVFDGPHPGIATDQPQDFGDFDSDAYEGAKDAFIAKFAPDGTRLWAAYFGGDSFDFATDVSTDAEGNVLFTGYTGSPTGIAYNGHDLVLNDGSPQVNYSGKYQDAFLVKMDPEGLLLWSTYYGGEYVEGDDKMEVGHAVATDQDGNVFLTGYTTSSQGIATKDGHDTSLEPGVPDLYDHNLRDAFLVKFDPDGNRLWATYFGGDGEEVAHDVTVDIAGNPYIVGYTESSGLGYDGYDHSYGGNTDVFVAKFDPDGELYWSTYYGSDGKDLGKSITTDGYSVYVAGVTDSDNSIAFNGYDNTHNGEMDAFIVAFNLLGQRLWGTYYGGEGVEGSYSPVEWPQHVDIVYSDEGIGPVGVLYLAGPTNSMTGIASPGAMMPNWSGHDDGFIARFFTDGDFKWGTYYGGEGPDDLYSIAVTTKPHLYITGFTNSPGLGYNGHDNTLTEDDWDHGDAFLAKIKLYGNPPDGPGGYKDPGRDPNEREDEFDLTLSPNPTRGQVRVTYQGKMEGGYQIRVADTQGNIKYMSQILDGPVDVSLNLSQLRRGVYIISLINQSKILTQNLQIE